MRTRCLANNPDKTNHEARQGRRCAVRPGASGHGPNLAPPVCSTMRIGGKIRRDLCKSSRSPKSGGNSRGPAERPYLAIVHDPLFCGGSLVAPRAIKSAPHCFTCSRPLVDAGLCDAVGDFLPQGSVDVGRYDLSDAEDFRRVELCENEFGEDCGDTGLGFVMRHPVSTWRRTTAISRSLFCRMSSPTSNRWH